QLAKSNRVFYIDYPFTLRDCLKPEYLRKMQLRRKRFKSSSVRLISTDIDGLEILALPPLLSINFLPEGTCYRALLKINERIIRRHIRKVLESEQISSYIYINSFNFHYPGVMKGMNPRLRIYHCVDPMIIPYDKKHGIRSEEE